MRYFDIHTHQTRLSNPAQAIVSFNAQEAIHPDIPYASTGIHPWLLTESNADQQLQSLKIHLEENRVIAIGEAGLDKLKGCPLENQISIFRHEICLSEEYHLPIIIHCVRAFNELIQLKKEYHPLQSWIIHGFRGKANIAKELLHHGCYISFGENFQSESVRTVPLDKIFIETDTSETDIAYIFSQIAEIKGISLEELVTAINRNVEKVFFKR